MDVYTIFDEEQRPIRLSSMSVKSPVFAIRQLAEWVYIALGNGHLTIHRADSACEPTMSEIESSSSSSCSTSSRRIVLGSEPVAALAVHYESGFLYAACGRTVYLVRDGHIEVSVSIRIIGCYKLKLIEIFDYNYYKRKLQIEDPLLNVLLDRIVY